MIPLPLGGVSVKRKQRHPTENFPRSQIMTPREAAKYLGIHLVTAYRLIKNGQIPGFRVGGQWRLKKDLLDAWIVSKINKNSGE